LRRRVAVHDVVADVGDERSRGGRRVGLEFAPQAGLEDARKAADQERARPAMSVRGRGRRALQRPAPDAPCRGDNAGGTRG
jgi:hypothetical protein